MSPQKFICVPDERRMDNDDHPLEVQLSWGKDDREGRFLLKREDVKTAFVSMLVLLWATAMHDFSVASHHGHRTFHIFCLRQKHVGYPACCSQLLQHKGFLVQNDVTLSSIFSWSSLGKQLICD
jgi:hypothetical protein